MDETVRLAARVIETLGALVIAWAILKSLAAGARDRLSDSGLREMHRIIAEGAVAALGLITAAALLKTITLRSWSAIGMFAAILALRTLLKRALAPAASAEPR